ncbi:MAG TPA: lysylphosphatidylglycerol synthase transmembrane domain-containing protein [Gemmatimonadaceae bacterium]|nr:lysylphosphatidylglycerol synthase transmembrane domain-containing protein [Gemmatimonadaceae bacterium]
MTSGARRFWLKAGVSGALLALLFTLLPWDQVRAAASRLSAGVWLGTLALFLAGHVLGALKWRTLVNACLARLRLTTAIRAYFAGLFANLYLPSIVGGDVLRGAMIGRETGRPEAAVLGGIADRVLDIATMGILIGIGALLSRDALPGWGAQAVTVLLVVGAVAGALFLPLALRRPLAKWPKRVRRPVGRSLVALRRLSRSPRSAAAALVLSLAIQSLFVVLNAWIGRDVGIALPLSVWFLVWPLAKVAGLMPISLGGIAVRDAALAGLLVPFGVPPAVGAVAGLLWQTINMAGGLVGGVVWWAMAQRGARGAITDARAARAALTPTR